VTGSNAKALEAVFQQCFLCDYRTLLRGDAPEPLYQPAAWPQHCSRIMYREDFFASALHEVAHWCTAGPGRRALTDYGYWYSPDGRDSEQQLQFEKAEYKTQALEWHFSLACNWPFRLSSDNLGAGAADNSRLASLVCDQAQYYCETGLPERAARFHQALAENFDGMAQRVPGDFTTTGL
jgi:elongation factor P hydroxylase